MRVISEKRFVPSNNKRDMKWVLLFLGVWDWYMVCIISRIFCKLGTVSGACGFGLVRANALAVFRMMDCGVG